MDNNLVLQQYDYDCELWSWKVKVSIVSILLLRRIREKKSLQKKLPKGRLFTRLHNSDENRLNQSWYYTTLREAALADLFTYQNFLRMTPTLFQTLAEKVAPHILRSDTKLRKSISVGERLALTLRYLATGDKLRSLAFGFHVGHSTASEIVIETCKALYDTLASDYLRPPSTDKWKEIALDFSRIWQSPNCVGAIDGKHIAIQCPPHAGSEYYNYKKFHSIILMAVCDAKYRFLLVDVGAYGREGGRNVFATSHIAHCLKNGSLGLPNPCRLPYSDKGTPHYFNADDAFPLLENMMKPFGGRNTGTLEIQRKIFNLRTSRSRRTIENAFGILASRFQIFKSAIGGLPSNVEELVKATVVLHNFLIENDKDNYAHKAYCDFRDSNGSIIPGGWRTAKENEQCFTDLPPTGGMNYNSQAKQVGETLMAYFMNEGSVPWQMDQVLYTGQQ